MGFFPPQPAAVASTATRNVVFERRRMKYAAVLLIGTIALEAPRQGASSAVTKPATVRSGPVRADGRAVADAAGPFNALGATLFWGAWAYKFDRPRLERNLEVLSAAGVDYVRVLGSVGGASWEDRQTDPRWNDYDAIIAGMTDLAYDRYGMRVQWTLFGGAPFTPSGPAREALVDRFASMARGREHKIFAFEIANEAWQNGFGGPDGLAELRRLGKRLNDKTTVLVALSSPATGAACDTYAGSGARRDDAALRAELRQRRPDAAVAPSLEFPARVRCGMSRPASVDRPQQRTDRTRELGPGGRLAVQNCGGLRHDVSRRQCEPTCCTPGPVFAAEAQRTSRRSFSAMRISTSCRHSKRSPRLSAREALLCRRVWRTGRDMPQTRRPLR